MKAKWMYQASDLFYNLDMPGRLYRIFDDDTPIETINEEMNNPEMWKQYLSKLNNKSALNESLA